MRQRMFYVALGTSRDADPDSVRLAYRRVVTRYRRLLEPTVEPLDEPTQPLPSFGVLRTYSERRHSSLFDAPEPLSSESEVDRFYGGFVPEIPSPPKARRTGKDLFVELRLAEDEAQRGGIFPVHIPVRRRCSACEANEEGQLSCNLCQGTGQITEDRMVEVTVPPGVTHGQVARIAMEDVGLDHTDLVVGIVVS
jgi:DnaJ-class molecular chaperone